MNKQIAFTLDIEPLVFALLLIGVLGVIALVLFRLMDLFTRRKRPKADLHHLSAKGRSDLLS